MYNTSQLLTYREILLVFVTGRSTSDVASLRLRSCHLKRDWWYASDCSRQPSYGQQVRSKCANSSWVYMPQSLARKSVDATLPKLAPSEKCTVTRMGVVALIEI